MDNLFAVMLNNADGNTNAIINRQLAKAPFNNKAGVATEINTANHTIYLFNYSSEPDALVEQAPTTNKQFSSHIIGNCRVDNKSDFVDGTALAAKAEFSSETSSELTSERKAKLAPAIQVNGNNRFSTNSAAENTAFSDDQLAILNAYNRFGSSCFSKLKGNFQAIFWDEQSQHFCAAIDAFSSRSLFYIKIGAALYIASDAKALAEVTRVNLTINKLAVSQWLSGRPTPNASMFNEISRLPAGHSLEYNKNHDVIITKFWDINADFAIKYNNTADYQAHLMSLLQTSVANRLTSQLYAENASVFCQMSGGMDSTSITAVAKQLMDKQNRPLHTISHQYNNTESCDESSNIADMIAQLNLRHAHFIELDKFQESSFAALYPTDFDSPGIVLSPKYHQELALMKSLGANILLTGNGGDETCWGHSASYRSRLYKGELGVIAEVIDACKQLNEPVARSLYTLFTPSRIQHLVKLARNKPTHAAECPPWLSPQAFELINTEKTQFVNPFSATFNPAKHARYHGLTTTSTYNSMRSYQKIASEYGIEVQHPFFDADIVKFSFAIPEKLLIQGIYPKWLLRQTMQDHLPASVCWNKHKVVFDHHFANLVTNNKVELRKLLAHEGLQALGLLDNAILLREFDAVVDNPNGHLNVDMLYAILTQLWFQTHCID